ncbi:MAG TPA: hypothetical protein VFK09_04570 [Gemmatimonadales bacterium]|jgi:hypothetical protein|nr:hypothetical protein [Gemmatimonadales bacterium]
MRIIQGRGQPTILVPEDRARARARRRVRVVARMLGLAVLVCAGWLIWRALPMPRVDAPPPLDVLAATDRSYAWLALAALAFPLALWRERLGGLVMGIAILAWLGAGPARDVAPGAVLALVAAALVSACCFIWLDNAAR